MKLFGRTGGYWLFWTTFIYFWVGMFDIFVYHFTEPEMIQMVWVLVLMIQVLFPIGRIVRGSPFWRKECLVYRVLRHSHQQLPKP